MANDVLKALEVLKGAAENGPIILGTFTDEELVILDQNRDSENSFDCPALYGLTPEERDLAVRTSLRMMAGRGDLEAGGSGSDPTFRGKAAILSELFGAVHRITTAVRTDRSDDVRQVAWRQSMGVGFVEQIFRDGSHQIIAVSEDDARDMLVGFVTPEMISIPDTPEPRVISGTLEDEPIRDLVMRASAEATYEVVVTTSTITAPGSNSDDPEFGSITVYAMPEGLLVLVNGDEGRLELRWCDDAELGRALHRMLG